MDPGQHLDGGSWRLPRSPSASDPPTRTSQLLPASLLWSLWPTPAPLAFLSGLQSPRPASSLCLFKLLWVRGHRSLVGRCPQLRDLPCGHWNQVTRVWPSWALRVAGARGGLGSRGRRPSPHTSALTLTSPGARAASRPSVSLPWNFLSLRSALSVPDSPSKAAFSAELSSHPEPAPRGLYGP